MARARREPKPQGRDYAAEMMAVVKAEAVGRYNAPEVGHKP